MPRPDAPRQHGDPLAEAQTDVRLLADVVKALVIRVGGEVVVTGDDLFVAQRCMLEVGHLQGGGVALRILMPAVLPPGPQEFIP